MVSQVPARPFGRGGAGGAVRRRGQAARARAPLAAARRGRALLEGQPPHEVSQSGLSTNDFNSHLL